MNQIKDIAINALQVVEGPVTTTYTPATDVAFDPSLPLGQYTKGHLSYFSLARESVNHFRIPNMRNTRIIGPSPAQGTRRSLLEYTPVDHVSVHQEIPISTPYEYTVKVLEGRLDIIVYGILPAESDMAAWVDVHAVSAEEPSKKLKIARQLMGPVQCHHLSEGDTLTVPVGAITRWAAPGGGIRALIDQKEHQGVDSRLVLTFLDTETKKPLGRSYEEWSRSMNQKEASLPPAWTATGRNPGTIPPLFPETSHNHRMAAIALQMAQWEHTWGNTANSKYLMDEYYHLKAKARAEDERNA